MTKLRLALPLLALVTMFGSSGCLWKRSIVHLQDHPERNVTLLETQDKYLFGKGVYQFWHCADEQGSLVCKKACDGTAKFACLTAMGGQTNLR